MNITILDDYQNVVRTLDAYKKIKDHQVTIWNDHTKDVNVLAERLKDTEALVLIRERTPVRAPLIERLNKLRIVSQRSVYPHIGATVASYGRAFGMNVSVWGREGSLQRARTEGYAAAPSREAFFEQSDVLSL